MGFSNYYLIFCVVFGTRPKNLLDIIVILTNNALVDTFIF